MHSILLLYRSAILGISPDAAGSVSVVPDDAFAGDRGSDDDDKDGDKPHVEGNGGLGAIQLSFVDGELQVGRRLSL